MPFNGPSQGQLYGPSIIRANILNPYFRNSNFPPLAPPKLAAKEVTCRAYFFRKKERTKKKNTERKLTFEKFHSFLNFI